jgi:hypothetical protein
MHGGHDVFVSRAGGRVQMDSADTAGWPLGGTMSVYDQETVSQVATTR